MVEKWFDYLETTEDQKKLFATFKEDLKMLLLSCQEGLTPTYLCKVFERLVGIPEFYKKIGFECFKHFLFHLSEEIDVRVLSNFTRITELYIFVKIDALAEDSEAAHIRRMVAEQKPNLKAGLIIPTYDNTTSVPHDLLLIGTDPPSILEKLQHSRPEVLKFSPQAMEMQARSQHCYSYRPPHLSLLPQRYLPGLQPPYSPSIQSLMDIPIPNNFNYGRSPPGFPHQPYPSKPIYPGYPRYYPPYFPRGQQICPPLYQQFGMGAENSPSTPAVNNNLRFPAKDLLDIKRIPPPLPLDFTPRPKPKPVLKDASNQSTLAEFESPLVPRISKIDAATVTDTIGAENGRNVSTSMSPELSLGKKEVDISSLGNLNLAIRDFKRSEVMHLQLSEYSTWSDFTLKQPHKCMQSTLMEKDITEWYKFGNGAVVSYANLKANGVYAAFINLTGSWTRIQIKEFGDRGTEKVNVAVVDHGFTTWIRAGDIRELKPEFHKQPRRSTKCFIPLFGLAKPRYAKAFDKLMSQSIGETFLVRSKAMIDGVLQVELMHLKKYC